MKISLIIPAHNEEHYIKNCLDYALDEISLDLVQEIIVVDNASSDATYSLVSDYITHHPIVKIIQTEVK
ncbi:glycosyltransferase [Patescibacteria group bacterium]|nr:glycosyltransferase [Patescibacteria group bacterium]